jgi:hypothetical protein
MLSNWFHRLSWRSAPVCRPARGTNRPTALGLEALEDRVTPSLLLSYPGGGFALRLTETSTGNDTVAISEPTAGTLHIDLRAATFDPASSTQGVSYASPGAPGSSSSADVSITSAGAIRTLIINLGDGFDTLTLGMTNAANGVGGVQVDHTGSTGVAVITLNNLSLSGDLNVSGGPIMVTPGDTVATHGGDLTLVGTGTPSVNGGIGVELSGATLDSGTGGNLSVKGTGNPGVGIDIRNGANIQAGGTGTVSLDGEAGSGLDDHTGVVVYGPGTAVTTADGNLSISGTGGFGTGDANDGIDVLAGAVVQAIGSGNVSLTGEALDGVDQNIGAYLDGAGTAVSTAGGNLSVKGVGAGFGSLNYGIDVEGGAAVRTAGAGTQLWQGYAPPNTAAITFNGLHHGSGGLQSGSGFVILGGDVIDLGGPNTLTSTNGSLILLEATTVGRPVDLGNAVDQSGALTFTPNDNAAITQQGPNAFGILEIGSSGGISTHADLSFGSNVILFTFGSLVPVLSVTNSIDVSGGHYLDLSFAGTVGPVVVSGANTHLTTHGGFIDIFGRGSTGVDGGVGVDIDGATLDSGVNGSIGVSGVGAAGSVAISKLFGVFVHNGARLQAEGTGGVSLNGTGGSGQDSNHGVILSDPGTAVTTVNGIISITGAGAGTGNNNDGIIALGGAVIGATGTGIVQLNGTGGNGTDHNTGVLLSSTQVTTAGGDLTVTGNAGGDGGIGVEISAATLDCSSNGNLKVTGNGAPGTLVPGAPVTSDDFGVYVHNASTVRAEGSGTLTLNGTGGQGQAFNFGVYIIDLNTTVTAVGGNLSIFGNGTGTGTTNEGILIVGGATVSAGGSVTLQAQTPLHGQVPGDTPATTPSPSHPRTSPPPRMAAFLQSSSGVKMGPDCSKRLPHLTSTRASCFDLPGPTATVCASGTVSMSAPATSCSS